MEEDKSTTNQKEMRQRLKSNKLIRKVREAHGRVKGVSRHKGVRVRQKK
jgi:hypothetical protein